MTPERWQQIEQLYHAALERAETERAAFLTRVCAGDETLRREVEVLLAANEQADTFLNERALEREAVKLVGARPVVRAGERINRYQIISHLGAGGMGEVWLAEDTSLGRRVAVKLLPAAFSSDAERVRRFEREARAAGMLNHPNILTVHDAGTHNGAPYIVAELLEGEELRAQLAHGALPLRRALDNAQQLARGLAAAHEKGIVHRDLKPENLFITKDGRLKILDFGLAKLQTPDLLHARPVAADGETSAPSIHTNPGAVLGTVGYMSPEQVRGEEADPRSDIFSFGTILYEMLSGRRAFGGGSVAEMLSAILKEEPPELGTTDSHVPPQLERIVRRCLEKQEQQRFHSAHDLSFALESLSTHSDAGAGTSDVKPVASAPASRPRLLNQVRTWIVLAALFLLCALALLPFAVAHLRHAPPTAAAGGRFTIAAPEKVSALRAPEISPDGRHLVFGAITEGKTNLWLRALGSLTAQPLPGATDVAGVHFWSPDSRSICFAADGKLKRFDLAGGRPQTLYDLPDGTLAGTGGGTWNRDGIILFTAGGVIYCVPAVGGVPTPVLESAQPQQEGVYRWPSFLPDGRHFLCLRIRTQPTASEIYLASLDSPATTRLTAANSQALYAASPTGSGYLLFARGDELLAASFDASSLKLTGQPFVVAEQVRSNSTDRGSFSVSSNGILVYDPTSARDQQQLGWVTRAGEPIETIGSPGAFQFPKLSPDGKHLAVARRSPQAGTNDIYVIELARGVSSRLTLDPADDTAPTWSPDGRRIVWASNRGGVYQLYQKLASGVGPEELLFKSDVNVFSSSWSADGRFILYIRPDPKTNNDLWLLPLAGARQPALFLQTPFSESGGRFSPDGRWIAYQSNDQRRPEVYVQPFPATGDKWQVSTQGGQFPHWRGDGKELFYLSLDGKLMAVAVKSGRSFAVELPQPLFVLAPLRALGNASYAVTADGRRFLFVSQAEETGNLQYTVVVNWAAEVKK